MERCRCCNREIGARGYQCTGWHPAFKCRCGYEAAGLVGVIAKKSDRCPSCRADQTLNAEFLLEDILDAEILEY